MPCKLEYRIFDEDAGDRAPIGWHDTEQPFVLIRYERHDGESCLCCKQYKTRKAGDVTTRLIGRYARKRYAVAAMKRRLT